VAFLCKSNEELHGKSGSNQKVSVKEFDHFCGLLLHTWSLVFYKGDFSPFSLSFLEKNFLFSFSEAICSSRFDILVPGKYIFPLP
jgi:hypothetical protein